MSIKDEIARIRDDKITIRNKLSTFSHLDRTIDENSSLDDIAYVIGEMPNCGSVKVTILEKKEYPIPRGYHDGTGVVKAETDADLDGSNYSTQSKTVRPTKSVQTVVPDGDTFALSSVVVEAIPAAYQDVTAVTATAADVLSPKIIVDKDGNIIDGTMTNRGTVTKTLDVNNTSCKIDGGYHTGDGEVNISLETKTATPTKSTQDITPTSGKVLGKVTVAPIPDDYQYIRDVTATADKVLIGSTFVDAEGNEVEGTMQDHSAGGIGAGGIVWDVDNGFVTVKDGYHVETESDIPSGALAKPNIAIHETGKIVATSSVGASGYLKAGCAETSESQLNVQPSKTITPTKAEQTAVGAGLYTTGVVKVAAIPAAYQDVSEVDATADKVLADYQFVDTTGKVVKGTIVDHSIEGSVHTINVENDKYFIPAGYYDGRAYVDVSSSSRTVTPTKSKQTINGESNSFLHSVTVNAIPDAYQDITGVTATAADVLSGKKIIGADGKEATGTMPNNGAVSETIAPIKGDMVQYDIPRGYHNGSGKIMIESIPDTYCDISNVTAMAETVLDGNVFVNRYGEELTGTMPNKGAVTQTLNTTTTSYTIPAGYHNGSGKVSITTETKSATPTKSEQTIKPTSGKVLSSVSVAAIPAAYQDVTSVNAAAGDVLFGKIIVNSSGAKVTGSMANNGAMNKSIDGLNATSVTIPAGYTTGGTVSLTDDIENALKAI